jgi:hypothetical protein
MPTHEAQYVIDLDDLHAEPSGHEVLGQLEGCSGCEGRESTQHRHCQLVWQLALLELASAVVDQMLPWQVSRTLLGDIP